MTRRRARGPFGVMQAAMLLLVSTVAVVLAATAAGADDHCQDVTVSGTVVLVPSLSSETINVTVPAGTYELVGTSFDSGHEPGLMTNQVSEKWSFTTDTGFASPISPDLPDADTSMTFSLGEATFGVDVSAITFVHHGDGNSANSIMPRITFRCVTPAEPPATTEPAPPATSAPEPTVAAPDPAAPVTTTVEPPATTAAPTTAPPTAPPADNSDTSGDPDAAGDPDVLPRTGTGDSLLISGMIFMTAGAAALVAAQLVAETLWRRRRSAE